ncbi:MAG TPA: CPBP family intramembrane glutamic endopeptidase [Anaerolineales bacterium]|nr:CPBP family intramembrane glutamic endopeptidase [Anaerolineales bacterium]
MATPLAIPQLNHLRLRLFTWAVVLLVSDLPNAIWQAVRGEPPGWLFWAKIGFLLILILAGLVWKPVGDLRSYFLLLMVLMLTLWGMSWLRGTAAYKAWEQGANWVLAMVVYQLLKLAVVAIMVALLWVLGKKREDFYLSAGQLDQPVMIPKAGKPPARRLMKWGTLGLILGICIAPLTILFFGIGNSPTSVIFLKALPYFPAVLLFAASNAFAEEMQFRASLLGELQKIIGPDQSIWLTATFFGLAHYFGGAPAGIPGVLIAGLLGALFAKCMLGSKGIVVPWFIHFCQNAVIYAFWAFGSVA